MITTSEQVCISIIIPTLREKENIQPIAQAIHQTLAGVDYEILFVDDCSHDGTFEVCHDLSQRLPVRLIVRPGSPCLSTAVMTGFLNAVGDYILVMDADMSHPVTYSDPSIAKSNRERKMTFSDSQARSSQRRSGWASRDGEKMLTEEEKI